MVKINYLNHLSLVIKPNHSTTLEEVFTFKKVCVEGKNSSGSRIVNFSRICVTRIGAERRSGLDLR